MLWLLVLFTKTEIAYAQEKYIQQALYELDSSQNLKCMHIIMSQGLLAVSTNQWRDVSDTRERNFAGKDIKTSYKLKAYNVVRKIVIERLLKHT